MLSSVLKEDKLQHRTSVLLKMKKNSSLVFILRLEIENNQERVMAI